MVSSLLPFSLARPWVSVCDAASTRILLMMRNWVAAQRMEMQEAPTMARVPAPLNCSKF